MVPFTIADVRNGAEIFLKGHRDEFIEAELSVDPEYVWDDDHWRYLDKFSIDMRAADGKGFVPSTATTVDTNSYVVTDWCGDSGHTVGEYGMTAEEVVVLINKMCAGRSIELIR